MRAFVVALGRKYVPSISFKYARKKAGVVSGEAASGAASSASAPAPVMAALLKGVNVSAVSTLTNFAGTYSHVQQHRQRVDSCFAPCAPLTPVCSNVAQPCLAAIDQAPSVPRKPLPLRYARARRTSMQGALAP